MKNNDNFEIMSAKGQKICVFLPPFTATNPITNQQTLGMLPCQKEKCEFFVSGDCSLKGVFHMNYKIPRGNND